MITVNNLHKKFKNVSALQGVDFSFVPGKVTGIIGPNGCGKTTLIKSILGLVVPDAGEIMVGPDSVQGHWGYRRQIGYMPQNSQFPGNLTSRELFDMVEDIQDRKGKRREELIEIFEIKKYLDKPMGQLSGGTRQKSAAILAFMFDPEILILDEPTVGLDPVAVVRLKKLISQAAQAGKTIILVTHMLAEIEQLVDDMYFLLDGKIKFFGPLDEIKKRAGIDVLDHAVVKLMSAGYQEGAQS